MGRVSMRWARRLLRLYPRAWRERYEDEVIAVLAQHRVTVWTMLDVALGAVDAHLHPELLPGRLTSMAHRIRTSEIAIFCAFVVFALAWLPVEQLRDPLPDWERAVGPHPEIRAVYEVVQAAGGLAFLAILAGGIPILWATLAHAIRARRREVLLLLLVPVGSAALLAGYALLASGAWTTRQAPAPNAPLTPLAVALQLGLLALLLLAVAGSTVAVARAVTRVEVSERVLRYALVPAALATVALGVGLVATVVLVALTFSYAPQLEPGNLAILAAVMLVATAVAGTALRRGLTARTAV